MAMKQQAFNPYLPSWEYVPDGEPHVFSGRVYVYGSHDFANGYIFCPGDYVCYSAPVQDLSDWRYEGVIYPRKADPLNREGKMCLYAPDVTRGPDGSYYLYYVLDKVSVVSVAVCDSPAGEYRFLGYVRHADGSRLGEREGDVPQFDPGVLTEGDKTYLYTGFCGRGDRSRPGAMATVLGPDMLGIVEETKVIVPGCEYGQGTGFEGHEFFEAPSIRKRGELYYFVYSSILMHELCYATSRSPTEGFCYGGVVISNADMNIGSYKRADMPAAYGANNHGGLECVQGQWYVFYHRHTHGTWFSRQGCAERISILDDGSIPQVELTSCGLNGGPLVGKGEYPAYIACNMFCDVPSVYVGDDRFPRIVQDGRDGDEEVGYIANIKDGACFGFKYFDFRGLKGLSLSTRGYAQGHYELRSAWDGECLARVEIGFSNVWEEYSVPLRIPDGPGALYLKFKGSGTHHLKGFTLT